MSQADLKRLVRDPNKRTVPSPRDSGSRVCRKSEKNPTTLKLQLKRTRLLELRQPRTSRLKSTPQASRTASRTVRRAGARRSCKREGRREPSSRSHRHLSQGMQRLKTHTTSSSIRVQGATCRQGSSASPKGMRPSLEHMVLAPLSTG